MTTTAMYTEMLREAEADLRKASTNVELRQADVDKAQAAYASAREQHAKMQATCEWIRERLRDRPEEAASAAAAQPTLAAAANPVPAPTGTLFGKPMPEVTNTSLCVRALEQLGTSATTKEVREQIRKDGHELSQGQVRQTLKYLADRKNPPVENPEPGVWLLARSAVVPLADATVLPLNNTARQS